MEKGDSTRENCEKNRSVRGMKASEEVYGSLLVEENEENPSSHNTEFGVDKAYEGLGLTDKFSSLLGEADISGSIVTDEENIVSDQNEIKESNLGPISGSSKSSPKKENKTKESPFPCDVWWKSRSFLLCSSNGDKCNLVGFCCCSSTGACNSWAATAAGKMTESTIEHQ